MRRLALLLILVLVAVILVAVGGRGSTAGGVHSVDRETSGDSEREGRSGLVPPSELGESERIARTDGLGGTPTLEAEAESPDEASERGHPSSRGMAFLRGRLFDPEGDVVARAEVTYVARFDGADRARSETTTWTSQEGRFKCGLRSFERGRYGSLTLRVSKDPERPLAAVVEIPPFGARDALDLGDIRMEVRRLDVVVRFVRGENAEIIDERVQAKVLAEGTGIPFAAGRRDPSRGGTVFVLPSEDSRAWLVLDRVRQPGGVGSDHVRIGETRLFLDARDPNVVPDVFDASAGLLVEAGTEVDVPLAEGGAIEGTVVVADGTLQEPIVVIAARKSGVAEARPAELPAVFRRPAGFDFDGEITLPTPDHPLPLAFGRLTSEGGHFRIEDVPPGTMSLAVRSGGRVLAVLHGLEIVNLETCRDARLSEIVVVPDGW